MLAWLAFVGVWSLAAWARASPPPAPTQHLADEAGVISPDVVRALSERLASYEQRSGHQVIVWIGTSAGDETIEQFAVEAFEAWGVGNAKLDDGVALFVMVEDRKVRIEVGYGLEPTVTDLLSDRIIRQVIVPRIKANDWDGAIVGGVEALVDTIEGRPGSLPGASGLRERGPPPRPLGPAEIVVMVVLGLGFLILMITHPRLALMLLFMFGRGGGGGTGLGGGGFRGRGGGSGGGGATGGW